MAGPADFLDGLDPAWRARQSRESWGRPDHTHVRSLLAERDSDIVDFVHYGPYRTSHRLGWAAIDAARGGEVYSLHVHPDHWGNRIGGRLLGAAVADLTGAGLTPIRLWILHGNTRAIRFYRRHGFVPDGTTQSIRLGPARTVEATEDRLTLGDAPGTGGPAGPA